MGNKQFRVELWKIFSLKNGMSERENESNAKQTLVLTKFWELPFIVLVYLWT